MPDDDRRNRFPGRPRGAREPHASGPELPSLVVIYTAEPRLLGKRFLLDRSPIRAGRSPDNEIVLETVNHSRHHAHFELRDGAWFVVDDESSGGTYLNDEHIPREAKLTPGDRVRVGGTIFKLLAAENSDSLYHEEIYKLTVIDGLTGLHNRRYMNEQIERELIRARRHERPLSLLQIDVDSLARLNYDRTHAAGDEVIRGLAAIVKTLVDAPPAVIGRYGGDEILVLLANTPLPKATILAEKIRKAVEEKGVPFEDETLPITVSVGVADLRPKDRGPIELIRRAEEACDRSKAEGRNRVTAARDSTPPI